MIRIKNVIEIFNKLLIFIGILLFSISVFAVTGRTTYQAKIIKPDGYPLEATAVNFRFTILDPLGSCVLYSEDFAAVNMSGTGGLISFALGAGTRSYPVSATTFASVFDNSSPAFTCQTPGVYNPALTDNRKIVMQFQDVNGWQTLPAMSINSVPFAMYAEKSSNALQLNGKSDTAFVENATLASLACNSATHAIAFNGVSFSCLAVGSGSGGGINSVSTSGTVLVTGGTASAPVITIQAATMSQDGYLTSLDYAEFKAKLSASSSQIVSTLGYAPVSSSSVAIQIDAAGTASATANTIVKRNASGDATFADVYASSAKLNYVDIYRPSTSFSIRLQASTTLSSNYVLNLPSTSGTTGQVLSSDGAGNLSWINPATGSVTSVSATAPLASTGGATPTISITPATSSTAGYLSATDFNTFNNKLDANGAAIISTLGYAPVSAASGTQWTTSGANIYYNSGNVGIGVANPSRKLAVNGAMSVDNIELYASGTSAVEAIIENPGTAAGNYSFTYADVNGQSLGRLAGSVTEVQNQSNSTVTDIVGLETEVFSYGLAQNAHGLKVTSVGKMFGGSDPVNTYGVYIGNLDGANKWSFYSSDSTAESYFAGNVGIGTTSPITKLEVSGGVRISMESATCSVTYAGTLRYNSGNVELCNGTSWAAVGSSSVTSSTVISALGYTPLASGTASFLVAEAGSQASPTVRFSPDASTGFYRFGVNSIGVSVNNTFLARFDSLGLQVQGNISAGNQCPYKICIGVNSAPGLPTPALTDLGQVIGVIRNGPATTVLGNGLYVTAGGSPVGSSNKVGGDLILGSGIATGNATSNIELRTASGTVSGTADVTPVVRMKILGNGNVGIGLTNPQSLLHIREPNDNWESSIRIDRSYDSETDYVQMMYDYEGLKFRTMENNDGDPAHIIFKPRNVEAVRISDNGNFGIGTTTPTHVLDVADNGNDALMKITEFSNTYPADIRVFRARGTQAGPSALVSGDVIGGFNFYGYGSAAAPIQRSAAIEAVASQDYTASARGADLVFRVAASGTIAAGEAMRISQSGFVGIGTVSPTALLDVNGRIKSTMARAQFSASTGWSTTSTAWVDTDVALTLNTTGGPLLLMFNSQAITDTAAGIIAIRFVVDGNPVTTANYGNAMVQNPPGTTTYQQNISANWLVSSLSPGSHTVKVQVRIAGASNGYLNEGAEPSERTFIAIEQ